MQRVSTEMNTQNFRKYIQNQESQLNRVQNNLGTQTKFQKLRENPLGAASVVRYDSYLVHLKKFSENSAMAQSNLRIKEGYMSEALSIMNRVKDLSIQGANGTYSNDDMRAIAIEVNELLEEMLSLSNAKGADGKSLFAGEKLNSQAFIADRSKVIDGYKEMISSVEYQGDIFERSIEISSDSYISDSLAGNKVFWAQNQRLESNTNAESYIATGPSEFSVDGATIAVEIGDGIYDIIDKINNANIATRASLDPVSKGIVFETTIPHQIWFDENIEKSQVLADLGILSNAEGSYPTNLNQNLKVSGGSVFDVMMSLRDNLMEGNHESVGSIDLQGVTNALDNLLNNITDLGSRDNYIGRTIERLDNQIPLTQGQYTDTIGLNMAEAITEFNMLNLMKDTTLGVQAKLSQVNLLNFLK